MTRLWRRLLSRFLIGSIDAATGATESRSQGPESVERVSAAAAELAPCAAAELLRRRCGSRPLIGGRRLLRIDATAGLGADIACRMNEHVHFLTLQN